MPVRKASDCKAANDEAVPENKSKLTERKASERNNGDVRPYGNGLVERRKENHDEQIDADDQIQCRLASGTETLQFAMNREYRTCRDRRCRT